VAKLQAGEVVEASDNAIVSPTYVPDLVHATLDLLLDGESGLWHLANQGSISWHGLAREIAGRTGLSPKKIRDSGGDKADTTLASSRGQLLRPLEAALDDFVRSAEGLAR
jgi:dTDP-4-dehydrorhamnose reductase